MQLPMGVFELMTSEQQCCQNLEPKFCVTLVGGDGPGQQSLRCNIGGMTLCVVRAVDVGGLAVHCALCGWCSWCQRSYVLGLLHASLTSRVGASILRRTVAVPSVYTCVGFDLGDCDCVLVTLVHPTANWTTTTLTSREIVRRYCKILIKCQYSSQ